MFTRKEKGKSKTSTIHTRIYFILLSANILTPSFVDDHRYWLIPTNLTYGNFREYEATAECIFYDICMEKCGVRKTSLCNRKIEKTRMMQIVKQPYSRSQVHIFRTLDL